MIGWNDLGGKRFTIMVIILYPFLLLRYWFILLRCSVKGHELVKYPSFNFCRRCNRYFFKNN